MWLRNSNCSRLREGRKTTRSSSGVTISHYKLMLSRQTELIHEYLDEITRLKEVIEKRGAGEMFSKHDDTNEIIRKMKQRAESEKEEAGGKAEER
jgi:hypothetical protein